MAKNADSDGSIQSASGITANDFLTLLVTEMKNQDPTANVDPNEYINQLVNVNSLQQLISINQTLSGAFEPPAPTSDQRAPGPATANSEMAGSEKPASTPASGSPKASMELAVHRSTSGNLGIPPATGASERLAEALSVHARAR